MIRFIKEMDVLLEFAGNSKAKAQLVGGQTDEFILIRLPLTAGVRERCREGNQVVVRFLHEGAVYGFRTAVIEYTAKPFSLVYMQYPFRVETHLLRHEERITCRFRASLDVAGRTVEGKLVDISKSGCRFKSDKSYAGLMSSTKAGDKFKGRFTVLGVEKPFEFEAELATKSQDDSSLSLGLKFTDPKGEVHEKIDRYVQEVGHSLNDNEVKENGN